jgi:LacI family transcriptional regulator
MQIMKKPTVAVLVDTFRAYGRGLSRGFAAYAAEQGGWDFEIKDHDPRSAVPEWIHTWKGDGIICRVRSEEMCEALANLKCPVVDMYGQHSHDDIPLIDTDPNSVAKTALKFFLDAAFTKFAFCGLPGLRFSDEREEAFVSLVRKLGFSVEVFDDPTPHADREPLRRRLYYAQEIEELEPWIATLPPHTAVLACNDRRAQHFLMAAARVGRKVPEELAVMGVDNDDVICELANPPLSSIRPDTYTIGYTAATWLNRLMRGESLDRSHLYIAPLGVQERASTDIVPSEDVLFVKAIRFIRSNVQRGIDVKSVVDHVGCCRSTLEGRFKQFLRRSVKEELTRARLAGAKVLLQETSLTLEEVANSCGFATASHFSRVFRESEGRTPGQFRIHHEATRGD